MVDSTTGRRLGLIETLVRWVVLWGPATAAGILTVLAAGLALPLGAAILVWYAILLASTVRSPTKQGDSRPLLPIRGHQAGSARALVREPTGRGLGSADLVFVDARTIDSGSDLLTDVCVIGAGAAGISIARAFGGTAVRLVLIESGGFEFDAPTQGLYAGANIGLPYFPPDTPRLRMFGGSTNHYGGICRPLEAEDFEARDLIPGSGWPIRKVDIDPYYPRAGKLLGLPSPDWELQTWLARDGASPSR